MWQIAKVAIKDKQQRNARSLFVEMCLLPKNTEDIFKNLDFVKEPSGFSSSVLNLKFFLFSTSRSIYALLLLVEVLSLLHNLT